jgi:hypothetical protein
LRIRLREEGIKIMEQPKYRFEDLHLQSDKEYLDIKEQLIGFLIDKDIDVPFSIKKNLEKIINNMLAENFLKTQQVLYPKDFEVRISVEVDTKTNVMMVNTYIYDDQDLGLHTSTNANVLQGYDSIKHFFFDTLIWIESMRIANLRAAVV